MSFSRMLKERAIDVWEDAYAHPFVQELGKGTLAKEKFQFYLLQDYQYLKEYAKVFALGAIKSQSEELIRKFTENQHYLICSEMNLHRQYMASFGITPQEMDEVKASLYNRTYTSYMLSMGQEGGLLEILATLFPCPWTYGEFAVRLKEDYAEEYEDNFYRSWIDTYADDNFHQGYQWFFEVIDNLAERLSEEEKERIVEIFTASVQFEYLFWDMAYKQEMSYRL